MEFKDEVKYAREQLLLSQMEFAKELGVAFATLNRWERGIRQPTYVLKRKFYKYCSCHNIPLNGGAS